MIQSDTASMLTQLTETPKDLPAFDPDHPDSEIHADFESFRRVKAWAYQQEDINRGDWTNDDDERVDDAIVALENQVLGNYPTTPISAAMHLMLLLPRVDAARALDRDLAEIGPLPLGREVNGLDMDWTAKRMLSTVNALYDMEWTQALEEYERSETDFSLALKLCDAVTSLRATLGEPNPLVDAVEALAKEMEDRHSNNRQLNRLLRTPPPDWTMYQAKAAIAIKECLAADAAPWLARDVNLLMGNVTVAKVA